MAGIRTEFLFLIVIIVSVSAQDYFSTYSTPADCKNGTSDIFHEYYDASSMTCQPCHENNTVQTSSVDKLTCICRPRYRYSRNFGGKEVRCVRCANDEAVSSDGWECVKCDKGVTVEGSCAACQQNEVQVGRGVDGNWRLNYTKVCEVCGKNTRLNFAQDRCVRCNKILAINPALSDCTCADEASGYCFNAADNLNPETSSVYTIPLQASGSVESKYFKDNLRAVEVLCRVYKNMTACQQLANMCTLLIYNIEQDACKWLSELLFPTRAHEAVPTILYNMNIDDAEEIIQSKAIPTGFTFSPIMVMKFKVARYGLDGKFVDWSDITGGLIQLCEDQESITDAAFVFGTVYSQSCQISPLSFWNQRKYPLEFFDIYMEYTDTEGEKLYQIPLLITNYKRGSSSPNTEGIADWQLVRRFFLVDNEATVTPTGGTVAEYVRYTQSVELNLQLQYGTTEGKIYVPYFKITYGEVSREDALKGGKVSVSFSVSYSMDQSKYTRDFQIATGTLGTLAVLYAGYRTWVWSKRGRRVAIDFPTILNFIFYLAGSLANTFFVITFGIAFYWLIFYKRQSAVYLVHPSGQALEDWLALFGSAFALKALSVIHMMVLQCTVDMFLIDWERPKGPQETTKEGRKAGGAPVSIWRTYFVANEWNEIQAIRKTNHIFQIFASVFFLSVVGFENVATMDPDGDVVKSGGYQSSHSYVYRYAIAVLVYLLVAFVQWLFYVFIYERFIEDRVRQFVDLCSMSNVSVFIMANSAFGYYIHGRSVHGKADTDMKEMQQMMAREEGDMCGKRGLMPNTEQQTFQMSLPNRLREKYDQVYIPAAIDAAQAKNRDGGKTSVTNQSVEAYTMINKFLGAFVDHSLRDLDYVVKDKTLLESIMDTEFFDIQDKGIFYNDNGHSFDQILFFGNEITLIIFDCLLFCIVDHIATSFVLAGVITYIVTELIIMVRDSGGRKNLARKTLVDERFLI